MMLTLLQHLLVEQSLQPFLVLCYNFFVPVVVKAIERYKRPSIVEA